ncbi:MAG: hypothetical protein V7K35_03850 [Nostoc sp.]
MYRFWGLDIKANSVHSSKFSNPRTSSFNKSLTAWMQMAIAYATHKKLIKINQGTALLCPYSIQNS